MRADTTPGNTVNGYLYFLKTFDLRLSFGSILLPSLSHFLKPIDGIPLHSPSLYRTLTKFTIFPGTHSKSTTSRDVEKAHSNSAQPEVKN